MASNNSNKDVHSVNEESKTTESTLMTIIKLKGMDIYDTLETMCGGIITLFAC